ncbi:hypothetical protein DSO57_1009345 [Entomophthora muscae]|uniref:Uncharacterized protein n=1 Tax=Entomophthora muscae TaxID=34485 RepID=A0ACC2RY03_9FUNG|nr:hypothetical protein DSO57_1009345 [Entomophthora muscae]
MTLINPLPRLSNHKMNYIIFTAVLTAYLGIGGHQPTNAQFDPEPQRPKGILYNEPTHLNSMVLNPWAPLASSCPTPNLATFVIPAAMLLYLAVSLRQYKILAKAFCQSVNFYPIVYALNSFEPPNLTSYVTKVLSSILGYYNSPLICCMGVRPPLCCFWGPILSSDKAIDHDAYIKNLANHIIDIQATVYTSAYKTKMLELSPDNAGHSFLPKFNIGDHVLYYHHRVEGSAHKLDTL